MVASVQDHVVPEVYRFRVCLSDVEHRVVHVGLLVQNGYIVLKEVGAECLLARLLIDSVNNDRSGRGVNDRDVLNRIHHEGSRHRGHCKR